MEPSSYYEMANSIREFSTLSLPLSGTISLSRSLNAQAYNKRQIDTTKSYVCLPQRQSLSHSHTPSHAHARALTLFLYFKCVWENNIMEMDASGQRTEFIRRLQRLRGTKKTQHRRLQQTGENSYLINFFASKIGFVCSVRRRRRRRRRRRVERTHQHFNSFPFLCGIFYYKTIYWSLSLRQIFYAFQMLIHS